MVSLETAAKKSSPQKRAATAAAYLLVLGIFVAAFVGPHIGSRHDTAPAAAPASHPPQPDANAGSQDTSTSEASLPAYTISDLDAMLHSPHGSDRLLERKIRVRAHLPQLFTNEVIFMYSPSNVVNDFLQVDGLPNSAMETVQQGDIVDIVCEFTGDAHAINEIGGEGDAMRYVFKGLDIRKAKP